MSKFFGAWTGDQLLSADFLGGKPLIDQFLYEHDNVILVGREKTNKSTLALQMMCHLTSGEPLFGEYEIPHPIYCVYLQTEGKIAGTRANFENMRKVIPNDPSRMLFCYHHAIPLDRKEGLDILVKEIDDWGNKPSVLFIDPLYQSMTGDLTDQQDSSAMTSSLRFLQGRYECSIFLIHHGHRFVRLKTGEIIDEGDESLFGSFVWKAFPDTVLLIEKVKGYSKYRKLSCETQRMGNVVESLDLLLVEPSPFYLQIREGKPVDELVLANINCDPVTVKDVVKLTGKSASYVQNSIYRLINIDKIKCLNPTSCPRQYVRK